MAYTTAAAVKTWASIDNTTMDAALAVIIPQVQAAIDRYCNRTFEASSDTTRYFDALRDVSDDYRTLYLDTDLCAITTVTNGDSTTVTSSQYVSEPRNITPYYALTLKQSATIAWTYDTTPENAISITGKWAYSTSAPDDVVLAAIKWSLYLARGREADGGNEAMFTAAGFMVQPSAMPKDVKILLTPYRRLQ